MDETTFKNKFNRFGQFVSAKSQEKRYNQVLETLNMCYPECETYEVCLYDYRVVGSGKDKHVERYVARRETVNKKERARWHAEQGY